MIVMKNGWKKVLSLGLCVIMLLGLCACDASDVWVFSLNGEKLYSKDVAAFAYIYIMEHNIQNKKQLEEIYENSETYEEFYKQELEGEIISTTLLYKEAAENKIKLSTEQKDQVKESAAIVIERFGKDELEKLDVSESDIEEVYERRMLAEMYLKSLSDDRMDDATEKEVSEEGTETERYIEVYQVTFLTVELDENGMIRTDEEGNLKHVSSAEETRMKEVATAFAEKAQQGEDFEKLVAESGKDVIGTKKHLKYADLEKNYKMAIDKMSVDDVSDVFESTYGYYVVWLIEDKDQLYAETMKSHQKETDVLAKEEEEINRLYSEHAQENKGYKNSSLWGTIDIKDYMK